MKSGEGQAFPKAGWTDQASENRLKTSQTFQLMQKVDEFLKTHDSGEAVKTGAIKDAIAKGTSDHKRDIGSGPFSDKVWKDAIRLFLKGNPGWVRQGHALIKAEPKAGREVEEDVGPIDWGADEAEVAV